MIALAAVVVAPVQAITYPHMLDDMSNIAARPWTDDREPGEGGIGLLQQGSGTMLLDYGNTTDSAGTPNPTAGYDYQGNWVGHTNLSGGAFTSTGGYVGKYDRVPSGSFTPAELGILTTSDVFALDVYKPLTSYGEHVRELQLYDSLGNRNTYIVIGEGGTDLDSPGGPGRSIMNTPAGWTTFTVPLSAPRENNADLTDIVTVKVWASSWACYSTSPTNPYDPVTEAVAYAAWPHWVNAGSGLNDWSLTPISGLPLLIDNLRLILSIEPILDFLKKSVEEEKLGPIKEGKPGQGQLGALINMIETAGNLIEGELIEDACWQLQDALAKTDGLAPPESAPDFVTGEAAEELASKIQELMTSLGCE